MRWLKLAVTVFLCAVIVMSSLLLLASLFLRSLIFSKDFYADVISMPAYQPMVRAAIVADLDRQSSYVGIPLDVLTAGLDETLVYMLQRQHVENVAAFLNFQADFVRPVYPADRFLDALNTFIEAYTAENNVAITQEQLDQLQDVADDSARIVQTHVTLIDLETVKDSASFLRILHRIHDMSHRLGLAFISLFLAAAGLVWLHIRRWRRWLNALLVSIWLTGSLLLVPSLVLDGFALHRRLAFETPYLLFAVSRLLGTTIRFFMLWGAGLFTAATLALVTLFMTRPADQNKARQQSLGRTAAGVRRVRGPG